MILLSAADPECGFAPLGPLLRSVKLETLDEASRRIEKMECNDLIERFRSDFAASKRTTNPVTRVRAFLISEELTRRGIPPWMRHHHLSSTDYSINQAFDLFVQDVRYLRRTNPEQAQVVRFRRCKALFSGSEAAFHAETAYCFNQGTRAAWKIVKTLSLTEKQQLSCMWLQSVPIAKRLQGTQAKRDAVFRTLADDLAATRRTKSFTDADAAATLLRRHRLWLCCMHSSGSPAEIAGIYEALTGVCIDRKVVARQLQIIHETLRAQR
jgi:hypothetical protein